MKKPTPMTTTVVMGLMAKNMTRSVDLCRSLRYAWDIELSNVNSFQNLSHEVATAIHKGSDIVVVLSSSLSWSLIRMIQ